MKKVVFSIITISLGVVTALLIAEAGFRIHDLFDKNRGLRNSMGDINRKYSHTFKPNSRFRLIASKNNEYNVAVRINNYGFRGKDISVDKKPDTVRIMAVGDSFTFGVGAEEDETIPFLIEKRLNDGGVKTEVINAGFGHYSPLLHYLRIRDEYLEFKPDLVLIFFDFSDLADDWRGEKNLVYDSSGKVIGSDPEFVNGKRDWWVTFRARSRLCAFIHNKLIRLIYKIRALGLKGYIVAKMQGKRAKAVIAAKQTAKETVDLVEYDGYLMIRGRDRLTRIKEYFKTSEKYLDLIKALLDERGIPMILVIYPYGIHVGPSQWGEGRVYWGFVKDKVYDDYYAFDMLEDYARENGVPYINLLPDFLKNRERSLFFDIDGHFTPVANDIASKAIVESDVFRSSLEKAVTRIENKR